MLKLEGVSVNIQDNSILRDISFEMKKGEVWCVVGENGAGKSTLLNAIHGTQRLSKGKIWFNELLIPDPLEELIPGIKEMGYVTQSLNYDRFLKVYDNLSQELPRMPHSTKHEKITKVSELCVLRELLDKNIEHLSGGEKQRVTLAKAIIKGCEFYLFDEPYSHLDTLNQQIMKSIVNQLILEKKSVLMVTHDAKEAKRIADHVLVLQNGQIIQVDTISKIVENPINDYVKGLFFELIQLSDGSKIRTDEIVLIQDGEGGFLVDKCFQLSQNKYESVILYNNQRFLYLSENRMITGDKYSLSDQL